MTRKSSYKCNVAGFATFAK